MATHFYSPKTSGFYNKNIHTSMPEDAFPVSDAKYDELMEGQSAGKKIVYKARKLQLEDYEVATVTWEKIRDRRDTLLTKCDWTQIPDAPMDEETRTDWREYRQKLRDITESFPSPEQVVWPMAPDATS
jgi:hypothetical protein